MYGLGREETDYRYFRAYGQMNRDRTPKELHERLQVLFKKNAAISKRNQKWFNATPVKFYAEGTTSDGKKCFHIYNMDHKERSHINGYNVEGTKDREYYELLRDSELPLLAHRTDLDPDERKNKEFQNVVKKRMKGEIKEIQLDQDLHDEKLSIDRGWKRINNLIAKYLDMMKDYLPPKDYSRRYDTTFLLIMEVEGTEYCFDAQDQNRYYVANSDIKRVSPEER